MCTRAQDICDVVDYLAYEVYRNHVSTDTPSVQQTIPALPSNPKYADLVAQGLTLTQGKHGRLVDKAQSLINDMDPLNQEVGNFSAAALLLNLMVLKSSPTVTQVGAIINNYISSIGTNQVRDSDSYKDSRSKNKNTLDALQRGYHQLQSLQQSLAMLQDELSSAESDARTSARLFWVSIAALLGTVALTGAALAAQASGKLNSVWVYGTSAAVGTSLAAYEVARTVR
jgi:hypothetical protein